MESLLKSSTLRFSRRADCYEPFDQIQIRPEEEPGGGGWRTFSKNQLRSRRSSTAVVSSSLSYRRERARRRLVFLQSYKLEPSSAKTRSEKLRKVVVRAMKSALVSIVSFTRTSAMGTCSSKSAAIHVVSPARVIKCC